MFPKGFMFRISDTSGGLDVQYNRTGALPEDVQADTLLKSVGTTSLSTLLVDSKTFSGPLDFENCFKSLNKHN